jgi:TolB-like protein/tetratricopeptide (TPR) repeat protein
VQSLRELLGDEARAPRIIVQAGEHGYALIAHVEPPGSAYSPGSRAPEANAGLAPALARRTQNLIGELRRRHVFKVAGAYLVAAWLVLQVAETTFEPLHLPRWWMTTLTIIAVIGLPIVTVLAWSYEITSGGIVADPAGGRLGLARPRPRRSLAPWLVAGVVTMAGITGFAWWHSIVDAPPSGSFPAPAFASVVVLPFVDMTPDGPGGGYLGDGLSEELSARLAQIRGLRVASRTSAFAYRGRNIDAREIGRTLGVRHVLEGSVRRADDSLRVTVQLIDAQDGFHVWSKSFDRKWRDLLLMQADIARSVTDVLEIMLAPDARDPATVAELDTRVFEPYLAGLALLRKSGDMSALRAAQAEFEEAIGIEPSFARAHAGLCTVLARRYERTRDPVDLSSAEQHCRKALELDASLVETEKALAAVYGSSGRFDVSTSMYRSLIARNPGDADGYIGLGWALEGLGQREEAERAMRRAVQVEPAYWGAYKALGAFLFASGRNDEAAAAFRRVTELTPASASGFNNLGATLQMAGQLDGAAEAFRRSLALEPNESAYSNLGTVYYYLGRFDDAAAEYRRGVELAGKNLTHWGNLADALWQIPERRAEATENYRRAVALAERELHNTPDSAIILAQLGYFYGRVGDAPRSRDRLEQAVQLDPVSPFVNYYIAVAAADAGDRDRAAAFAGKSAQAGYPVTLLRADPALKGIEWEAAGDDATRRRETAANQ